MAPASCPAWGWWSSRVRQTCPPDGRVELGRRTAHRGSHEASAPAEQWRECSRAVTGSELPHSHILDLVIFFISLSCNCNSYYVLNICHVLLTFHPFFLTCITALLALLPQFTEAETEVSGGENAWEVPWPVNSRTSVRSEVCPTPRSESPPPSTSVSRTVTDHWLRALQPSCCG